MYDMFSKKLREKQEIFQAFLLYLLLWQVVPLYPGAHSQIPSSGEQEAPFLQ